MWVEFQLCRPSSLGLPFGVWFLRPGWLEPRLLFSRLFRVASCWCCWGHTLRSILRTELVATFYPLGPTCCWRELWDRSFLCARCKFWGEEAWSSTIVLDTSSVNHSAEWSDDFLKPLVDEIWWPSVGTSQLVPAFWHSDTEVVARHCFTSPLRVY